MTTRFCLQAQGTCSREQLAIIQASRILGYEYHFAQKCSDGEIPIGDVPFCEAVFGRQPKIKDFYPDFLGRWRRRALGIGGIGSMKQAGMFYKDAWRWKGDATAHVYSCEERAAEPYWFSEPVEFINEWRYYIANGKLIATGWYRGNDERNDDLAAPSIDIDWPSGFSGAVDFGTLDDGRVALVEAHAPFACGWYGDDPVLYAKWQIEAWNNADYWKV